MATATLPLSDIVDVIVELTGTLGTPPPYNQGLIVGTSTVIPSVGANSRLRQYSTLAQMVTDGFALTDPEYLAASEYASQTPVAPYWWIGRQDLTALGTVAVDAGGTGYAVGDIVTVVQSGASGGQLQVTTVNAGVVTGVELIVGSQGTGYAVGTGLATTGGTGTGLTINITAIGESCLQAVQACRLASTQWYGFTALAAVDADIEALAAWAQSYQPVVFGYGLTSSAAVLNNTAGNVAATLKAANYNRMALIYSTTQSTAAPNNAYAAAAMMGMVCGLTTGLAGSYYTAALKSLVGITPETAVWGGSGQTYYNNITTNNCNVYVNFASTFSILMPGILPNGQYIDEIVNLDILTSNLQYNIMNLLTSNPSIPQTDAGQQSLLNAAAQACEQSVGIGFIAPTNRKWTGPTVLNLTAGQTLPQGYLVQSASYATAAASVFANRQAMPIYVSIIEAGAVQSVTIGVYDQR